MNTSFKKDFLQREKIVHRKASEPQEKKVQEFGEECEYEYECQNCHRRYKETPECDTCNGKHFSMKIPIK